MCTLNHSRHLFLKLPSRFFLLNNTKDILQTSSFKVKWLFIEKRLLKLFYIRYKLSPSLGRWLKSQNWEENWSGKMFSAKCWQPNVSNKLFASTNWTATYLVTKKFMTEKLQAILYFAAQTPSPLKLRLHQPTIC